jgi:hypothetical protein
MDIGLFFRVISRFWPIVAAGAALAIVLAFLSVAKVSLSGGPQVSYRSPEQWSSTSTIYITQAGFAAGRAVFDQVLAIPSQGGGKNFVPLVSDPSAFSGYSTIIAQLANSDQVQRLMARNGKVNGTAIATPVTPQDAPTGSLPFVQVSGVAASPRDAERTARQATTALLTFMKEQQDRAQIPVNKRVVLNVLQEPRAATLLKGHSKTRPVFIFIAAMCAVIGLVFVLENLRPRLRVVSEESAGEVSRPVESSRHSA